MTDPNAPFHGATLGRTPEESTPWHPERPHPAGRPNVLVVLMDDVGFAQVSAFGSDIETPAMDRVAAQGLRFNRYHTTAMCSPTRASLLTGRNSHAVGNGFVADIPTGYPGYTGRIPPSAATVARVLRDAGWATMAVGKWHLTPRNDRSAAGPYDTWPLAQGFEHFYGFLHGDANQWTPTLYRDNSPVRPPGTPEQGYHLSEDLADEAIRQVKDLKHAAPDKPFFLYFTPGTAHAPHQVPQPWIQRYAGQFDLGWEGWRAGNYQRQLEAGIIPTSTKLAERPSWVPGWESFSPAERQVLARFQEAFAGFLTHFDAQLGRLLDQLDLMGELDNTLVIITSDNGASAEGGTIGSINEHRFGYRVRDSMAENLAALEKIGGFESYNHYPWGWAWAGNAPFKLWKRYSWLGGTRVPFIVRPPGGVPDPGAIRSQLTHVVDLYPTILDVCGVAPPDVVDGVAQQRIDGSSMTGSFTDPEAPATMTTQYFEMVGSRSLVHDGWKATTNHVSEGVLDEEELMEGSRTLGDDRWSLYRLDDDFSEHDDLAGEHPEVVAELEAEWWRQAEDNRVLPLQDGLISRVVAMEPPLWPVPDPLVIYPGGNPVTDEVLPGLGLGLRVEALVDIPTGGGAGVLVAFGDWINGWAMVVNDGVLHFYANVTSTPYAVRADGPLPEGRHTLAFQFRPAALTGVLSCDGEAIGSSELPPDLGLTGIQIGGGGLRLGSDDGFPVSVDYLPPHPWTGTLHLVRFLRMADAPPLDEALFRREVLRRE